MLLFQCGCESRQEIVDCAFSWWSWWSHFYPQSTTLRWKLHNFFLVFFEIHDKFFLCIFTVLLPQADTLEDLNEWKNALENALVHAPSTSHTLGQNGIFRNDSANQPVELPPEQSMLPPNMWLFFLLLCSRNFTNHT